MRKFVPIVLVLGLGCGDTSAPSARAIEGTPSPAPAPIVAPAPSALPVPPTPSVAVTTGVDPCVVGTWRLTPENAAAFYRHAIGSTGAPVEILGVEGTSVVTNTAAGESTLNMLGTKARYRMTSGGPPIEMSLRLEGHGSARFAASNGTMTYTNSDTQITGELRLSVAGREQVVPWQQQLADAFGGAIRGTNQYRCEGGRLEILAPGSPGPVTWVR